MEVPVGVYETCVLLVFLSLTQITEQYLDEVTAEEQEVRQQEGRGQGSHIVSDSGESLKATRRMELVLEMAGGGIKKSGWKTPCCQRT